MTKCHAFFTRNALRGLALFVALGCFQVAQAQQTITRAPLLEGWDILRSSASSATIAVPSDTPPSQYVPARGGNVVVGQPSGALVVKGNVNAPVLANNKNLPIDVEAKIIKPSAGAAVAKFAFKLITPIQIGLALLDLLEELDVEYEYNPLTKQNEFFGYNASQSCTSVDQAWNDPSGWCQSYNVDSRYTGRVVSRSGPPQCTYQVECKIFNTISFSPMLSGRPVDNPEKTPITEQELADKLTAKSDWQVPKNWADSVADALRSGEKVQTETPTVSGPSSVPGDKVTTSESIRVKPGTTTPAAPGESSEPATKVTTTTTNTNVTYQGNKVSTTNITNSTTTITNNITNQTTIEGDTTTVKEDKDDVSKPEEEKPDFCEKNPDALACKKIDFDTPDGDIPRTTRELTYSVEDTFGGGSCPADVYGTVGGQSLKLYDWQKTCGVVITYLRPLILLLGAMGALFILIPGRDS